MVAKAVTLLLQRRAALALDSSAAKAWVLELDDMKDFCQVHDPTQQQFNAWWSYNSKRDTVLGQVEGGYETWKQRMRERLGQRSTAAVRFVLKPRHLCIDA